METLQERPPSRLIDERMMNERTEPNDLMHYLLQNWNHYSSRYPYSADLLASFEAVKTLCRTPPRKVRMSLSSVLLPFWLPILFRDPDAVH